MGQFLSILYKLSQVAQFQTLDLRRRLTSFLVQIIEVALKAGKEAAASWRMQRRNCQAVTRNKAKPSPEEERFFGYFSELLTEVNLSLRLVPSP